MKIAIGHKPSKSRVRPGVRRQAERDAAFERPTFSKAQLPGRRHLISQSGVTATALQDLRRFGWFMKVPHWFVVMAILLPGFDIPALRAQGSLTPPAPPGPTMLTLSQVEPRTPVDALHTPGNGAVEFAITSAGSYYLTTNLVGVSGKSGIGIFTNNVTLNLNGYSFLGASAGQVGIEAFSGTTNVIIRNGLISGWTGLGVNCLAYNGILENLSITGNGGSGVLLQNVCQVRNCTSSGNRDNGIQVNANCCLISGNVCNQNNQADIVNDAGIWVGGANIRIENNHLTGNEVYGIYVDPAVGVTNNIIVGNSVQGDGANDYFYSASQIVGPIMTNNATGIITNSNPWANFQF